MPSVTPGSAATRSAPQLNGSAPGQPDGTDGTPRAGRRRAITGVMFGRRASAVWALAAAIIGFGIAIPSTFLTQITLKTILGSQATIGMLALAALVPWAAGVFDISIAAVAGFAMVLVSWLTVHTQLGIVPDCLITLLAASFLGVVTATLVAGIGVNSLVTTLGMSSVALGLTQLLSNQNTITGTFSTGFVDLGQNYLWLIPLPFVYLLVLAAGVYWWLEQTASGRRTRAVGGNSIAARLAGIRTGRIVFVSLVFSALVAGLTGVVLASQVGIASEDSTSSFLLPAMAALFLGATQIFDRANVPGTLIAVLLLGVGTKGLQLLGTDVWVVQFFNGVVLLLAVAIAAGGIKNIKVRRSHAAQNPAG